MRSDAHTKMPRQFVESIKKMRIVHVCLANFYIDGYGYQENILPKIHKQMGHEVIIIASTQNYVDRTTLTYVEPSNYINEHGIPVDRLPFSNRIPRFLRTKVRAYEGLTERLEAFQPDIIFVHDLQFWDLFKIHKYARSRSVRILVDSHTDYVNSARGFISRCLLHGVFYRFIAHRTQKVVERFYPTLPMRADFMVEVYGLDRSRMELLPFGVDDTLIATQDRATQRRELRAQLGIPDDATVLVTGGKLDLRKNIHILIDRFSSMKRADLLPGFHLVVFGQPDPQVQAALAQIDVHRHVHQLGWLPASDIHRPLWAADLAMFPGTHSVLWEEAIGLGLGAVFHRWPGMDHLDLGGNVRFIDDALPGTLDRLLSGLAANGGREIRSLGEVATREGPRKFSYSAIAAKAIAPLPLDPGR